MKKYQIIILLLLVLLSCKEKEDNILSPNPRDYTPKVITETYGNAKLVGFVKDKAGSPLSGVTVFFGEEKAETDGEGRYELNTLSAGSNKRIWFQKDGFASTQKLADIREDLPNRMDASLFPIGKTTTMTSDGGTLETEELYLEIEPGGFVYSDGEVVESKVIVSATAFLTSEDEFFDAFPGDFRGQRENGTETAIESFGFIDVELKVETGEPVQLAEGVTALIKIKAPENAPSTIPMWHYDEDKAKWFEEGFGELKDGFYEARVSHFTKWNWDRPYDETSKIVGTVVDNSGNPIEGASVVQTGITYNFQNSTKTDENGEFELLTPESNESEIETFFDIYGSTIISYTTSPNKGELNDIGEIKIDISLDNIVEPFISNDPLYITKGETAIIKGKYFGQEKRDGYKLILNGEEVETSTWQNDLIEFTVSQGITDEGVIQIDRDGAFSRPVNYLEGDWTCEINDFIYYNFNLKENNGKYGISLRYHLLEEIPECIGNLKNLELLYLGYNQLTNLPESIGNLTNLEELLVPFNRLISIPNSTGELQKLEELNLRDNQLKNIPENIGNLNKLIVLTLKKNQLISLPESIGNLKNLELLALDNNQLTSLPISFGNLQNIEKLYLGNNLLTSLPESFSNLKKIRELILFNNNLINLPKSFGNLSNLIRLQLTANQLISLPESIGNLKNLERFDVSNNQLTSLPESIGGLENLERFDVQSNQLTSLPESIGNLKNLEKLIINGNLLTTLPESIKNLRDNLKELYIINNNFSDEEKAKVEEWLPNTEISW